MNSFEKLLTIFSPKAAESFIDGIVSNYSRTAEYSFEYKESHYMTLEDNSEHRKQVHINLENKQPEIQLYSEKKFIKQPIDKNSFVNKSVVEKISSFHQLLIEVLKDEVKVVSIHNVQSELETEMRGLEWIRVSIEVLKKAIEHCHKNEDLKFHEKLFLNHNKSGCALRFMILSLDFKIEFLNDARVKITCWDYKDYKESNPSPSFIGSFYHRKNQVIDLFIPLLVDMSRASTKI